MPAYPIVYLLVILLLLQGCATPYVQPVSSQASEPALHETFARMDDGYRLPLTTWSTAGEQRVILLAVHGLNDYRKAFSTTGDYLAARGISVIAYDQRGFGNSSGQGLWHGSDRLTADLRLMINLLRRDYPGLPLYLLGESMGGAVVLAAAGKAPLDVDGTILVAPAVWSRGSMPIYQRAALWLAAHLIPGRKLTGEGLDLHPSDNIDMLRALGRDPLVIKATRVDVLYGVSNLMDQAVKSGDTLGEKMLFLYGKHDDIVPHAPTCRWLRSLPTTNHNLRQILIYENGYHMLTRDLQAEVVLEDIAQWITAAGRVSFGRPDLIPLASFCP